jgi:hypothetical protein
MVGDNYVGSKRSSRSKGSIGSTKETEEQANCNEFIFRFALNTLQAVEGGYYG